MLLETLALTAILAVADTNPVKNLDKQNSELFCLASAVYFEARGELPKQDGVLPWGQLGVAFSVRNRVWSKAPYLPDSYCDVVHDPLQYSYLNKDIRPKIKKAKFDEVAWGRAIGVATVVYLDLMPDFTEGATMYCNPNHTRVSWCHDAPVYLTVGSHRFIHESILTEVAAAN